MKFILLTLLLFGCTAIDKTSDVVINRHEGYMKCFNGGELKLFRKLTTGDILIGDGIIKLVDVYNQSVQYITMPCYINRNGSILPLTVKQMESALHSFEN